MRGRFVTFEGIEGSGKSTQIGRLARRLREAGLAVVTTREPGGTAFGQRLRQVLLDPQGEPLDPLAELLLYAADRAQHVGRVIQPALAGGRVVVCDRFADASLAYQGYGRGLALEWVRALHRRPPLDLRPDRTILLDLDPRLAIGRARDRNAAGRLQREGRFEAEDLAFHERVRAGYLALAREEPERIHVVAAHGDEAEVEARVREALSDLFPELGEGA